MPQLDISTYTPQIVWLVITFAALFLIMWRAVVPRIGTVLEARQRRIDDNLDKAAAFKRDAEAAIAAYEKALAESRAEAHRMIAETGAEMAAEAARRQAELHEKLAARIADGEAEIARAKKAALENVRAVAVELARAAVEKLIGEAPDETSASRAVDRVIKAG